MDEAPSGPRLDDRGALRDIYADSSFAQLLLKVVEFRFQVGNEKRRHTGRGYDGSVVRVEGHLDVARWSELVVDIRTEEDLEINPP